ncbi:MAG: glycosyltransferase, partial [Candidatus Nomurabacteria bacterium]|nr:glycosyltransferase [Candidatus Nomurabacteria bacterium]
MNILQIGTIDNSGGAALISWKIKKALEKFGHKTSTFVASKYSNESNVFVIKRTVHRYFCYLFSNDIDLFRTNWILKTKEFKEADIIHCHNLHGWFFNLKTLEKMSKLKPVIWTLHDMWAITPHCAHSFGGELKNGFYQCPKLNMYPRILWHNEKYLMWRKKNIYNNSDIEIVVPSLWLKHKVENSVLKDKNIHLIYNGIDVNVFKKTNKQITREELNIPQDKKIVLFVSDGGKSNSYKGWVYIEKILEKYERNDVHFICIGGISESYYGQNSNISYVNKINNPALLAK